MLQQTRVATVISYYARFVAEFPDVAHLAGADLDRVLALWSGLGYYARARNLHRAAGLILERHTGAFPRRFEDLMALPGVGRSSAAAIAAFAFGERRAILDGNVKRVFARCFGVEGFPGDKAVEADLWRRAEALLPARNIEAYTQALMDLGATVCTRHKPRCEACPLKRSCVALADGRTGELPAPRPRKAMPQRETVFLVLLRQGEVLLEKRPTVGIWGGLWCLPQMPDGENAKRYCAHHFGAEEVEVRALPAINHGFTHFKLRIHPKLVWVKRLAPRAEQPGRVWINLEDALQAALPAPVRALLRTLDR